MFALAAKKMLAWMGVSAAPASIEIIIDFSTSTVEPHKTLVEQRWGSVKTSWEEKSKKTTTIFRFLITLQPLLEVIKEIFFSLFGVKLQFHPPFVVELLQTHRMTRRTIQRWSGRWGGWKVHCIYIVVRVAELAGRRLKSGRWILVRME